jgi:hypothetical protein
MAISGRYDNNIGPIVGSAQEGFDRPYQRVRRQADAELRETMAGTTPPGVPRDDTGLKNPDDEFAIPAPAAPRPRMTPGPHHPQDPEGRQGGYPPTGARPDRQPDGM